MKLQPSHPINKSHPAIARPAETANEATMNLSLIAEVL